MPFTLSIVIPVYNESRTITQIIEKLFNCLSMIDFEIIIVDDCSIDNTVEILNRLTEQHENVTLVQHESNKGKTEALKTGFLYCSGNIVLVQDADLEYDPKDIPGLIQPILEDRADVVYGSRLSGRNNIFIFKSLLANKTLSFASNLFTKYKFSDVETCYKALRLDIIKNMIITSERFGFEIEVTAKISKLQIQTCEIPISYICRSYTEGKKIGFLDAVQAFGYILKYNLFTSLEKSFTNIPSQYK